MNNYQYSRLNQDIELYGYSQIGNYRGFKFELKRHPSFRTWCGYIYLSNLDVPTYNLLDGISHGGLTYGDDDKIGFDCAHYNDFPVFPQGIYRDYDYVKGIITKMIDAYLDKE